MSYANSANIAGHLTTGQKAMFGQAMLEAEKVKADERRRAGIANLKNQESSDVATLPPPEDKKGKFATRWPQRSAWAGSLSTKPPRL